MWEVRSSGKCSRCERRGANRRLKQWRGITTLYDKHALIYLYLATIVLNHRIRM